MPVIDPWAILKNVRCGQVITISPEMSPEFAGDYEVVERRLFPQVAGVSTGGNGRLAGQPSQDAAQIEFVLLRFGLDRFTDQAIQSTYATVPDTVWWWEA